jgi:hypothetical protein
MSGQEDGDFRRHDPASTMLDGPPHAAPAGLPGSASSSTSDPIPLALTSTISGPWEGSAAELLEILTAKLGDACQPPKDWPLGARALVSVLKRRAPSLRRLGWAMEQLSQRSERGILWQIVPPPAQLTDPDEIVLSTVRQEGRQVVHQDSAPCFISKHADTGQNPDELTNKPPHLSVLTEMSKRSRDVPHSSSSRHSVSECLVCGHPLAADLIADDIHRHIGCEAS